MLYMLRWRGSVDLLVVEERSVVETFFCILYLSYQGPYSAPMCGHTEIINVSRDTIHDRVQNLFSLEDVL